MRKSGTLEETTITDPRTQKDIYVSTTVRLLFRKMYPDKFAHLRNAKLNEIIASDFSHNSNNVYHYFWINKKDRTIAEIRKGSYNLFYISVLRENRIDILTMQNSWKVPKNKPRKDYMEMEEEVTKTAQVQSLWPQIYQKLKSPPPGVNLGSFPSKLPSMEKIILDPASPPDKADALGYVSTEDTNQDGKLDSMHIVVPNLERHLKNINVADLQGTDPQKIYNILAPFVEIIAHEMGHQQDYKHESNESFPGGEGAAESAAKQTLNQTSVIASRKNTNNSKQVKFGSFNMKKEIIARLVKLSGDLSAKGAEDLSDQVITLAEKFAQHKGPFIDTDPAAPLYQKFLDGGYGIYPQNIAGEGKPKQLFDQKRYSEALFYLMSTIKDGFNSQVPYEGKPFSEYVKQNSSSLEQIESDVKSVATPAPLQVSPDSPGAKSIHAFLQQTNKSAGEQATNIKRVQEDLVSLGYSVGSDSGKSDGDWGPVSQKSWQNFIAKAAEVFGESSKIYKALLSGNMDSYAMAMKIVQGPAYKKQFMEHAITGYYARTPVPHTEDGLVSPADDKTTDKDKKEDEACMECSDPMSALAKDSSMDTVVKNASLNSVFWSASGKTPFRR